MNFLDAVNLGFNAKNAVGADKGVAQKAKKKRDEESLEGTQDREQAAALAAAAGGEPKKTYASDPALPSSGLNEEEALAREKEREQVERDLNITDDPDGKIAFGIMDDERSEEVPEFSYEDLAGEEAAREMTAGLAVGNEAQASAPVDDDPSFSLEEAFDKPDTKSPLIDPTVGARPAGIPIEAMSALFKKTHGGSFDPNSKTDRLKMKAMEDMTTEDKSLLGLSPAKFAMKVYARK